MPACRHNGIHVNYHLKEKIKFFTSDILGGLEASTNLKRFGTTNQRTRRKNKRATSVTAKRRGQSENANALMIPDLLRSGDPIRMHSINNLENSMGLRQQNQQSYLLPNDMSLTYLLQNPLNNPGQVLNEIQSMEKSSESSQRLNLMMEQELFTNQGIQENFINDIQIIFNTDDNNTENNHWQNGSEYFSSDVQMQLIDDNENRWHSVSNQSHTKNNNNLSKRKEILEEIMDNGFIDEPVDEVTAEKNLDKFKKQQNEDLLMFQKESTKKMQKELSDSNDSYFSSLQNSTFKDRKLYKIKNPQYLLDQVETDTYSTKQKDSQLDASEIQSMRLRGQKRMKKKKNSLKNQKKERLILDTSIDQKFNSSSNDSWNFDDSSEASLVINQTIQERGQVDQALHHKKGESLQHRMQNNQKSKKQASILNSNLQQLCPIFTNQAAFSSTPLDQYLNELEILSKSNLLTTSENYISNQLSAVPYYHQNPNYHPIIDELDQIKNTLDEIGYTYNNKQFRDTAAAADWNPLTQQYQSRENHHQMKENSINSSFSQKHQSSEYSSSIAMVMHDMHVSSEKKLLMEDYQQVFSNQDIFFANKDQDSSSNRSKQDQLSQHSLSIKQRQLSEKKNMQSAIKSPYQKLQLSEGKHNFTITQLPEFNTILDPIIEGQTSLMMLQGFHEKSSFQQEDFFAEPLQYLDSKESSGDSNSRSVQSQQDLRREEQQHSLSHEASQLLKLIVQKMKERKQNSLELEKNFKGNSKVKSLIFYNLLSLKAASQIELIQREPLTFSPVEISIAPQNNG